MEAAAAVNVYLNATEPWKTAKDDPDRTATTLFVALQAISGLRTAFAPYLPFSTETLGDILGQGPLMDWRRVPIGPGQRLGVPEPLFRKVEGELDDGQEGG